MSLKFWKHPKYFDFERHRKPVVVLHDFISAIVAALGLGSIFGAGTVIGVAAGGMVYGVSGSFLASLIVSGALMAVSTLVSGTQKPSDSSFQSGKELSNTMSVGDPIGAGYGCRRIGATRVFVWSTTGVNLKDLHIIYAWGEGPMKGPKVDGAGEMIYLDDRRMQYYQTYKGLNLVYHEFHKGTHDQTVSTVLQSYIPAWAEAMRFTAYSYMRFRHKEGAWGSLPNVTCIMEMCENVFDDRDGSHGYSRNPVLATRDFVTHPRYGGGVQGSLVDSASQIVCANWVDDVSHRYYFDGIIKERQPFGDNVQAMLSNFKGDVVWSGGTYKTIIQKWDAPVVDIDELSIEENPGGANALGIDTGSSDETPKRVKGYFADPTDNYNVKPVYWPQVAPDVAESDKISAEFSLIGTAGDPTDPAGTAYKQALRILKYQYLRQRFSKTFTSNLHPSLYGKELGDIFSISHNPLIQVSSIPSTWNLKPFRILKIAMNQDNKIALQVIEEDSSIYDETVEIVAHAAFTPVLPGFDDALDVPTNLTATTGEDESTAQKVDAYVLFSWDNVRFGSDYQLRWRKSTDSKWKTERVKDPSDATEWAALTPYSLGAFVYPTSTHLTNYIYEVTIIGTSGALEPTWPTTPGDTVVNGSVTFTCRTLNRIEVRVPKFELGVIIYWQVKTLGEKIDSEWATPGAPIVTWAPSTPAVTGVTLTVTGQEKFILLSWTDPTNYEYNVYKWQVYRGTTAVFGSASLIKKDPGAKREYKDSQVSKGILYNYWLKIENKNGLVSSEIGPSTGQLTDPEVPGPPVWIPDVIPPIPNPPTGMTTGAPAIQATGSDKYECNISWNACTDESGDVTYTVWWWKHGTTNYHKHGEIKDLTFTLTNLEAGFTYHWKLLAADSHNNKTSFCADQDIVIGSTLATPTGMASSTGFDEETANLYDTYLSLQCDRVAGLDYEFRFRPPAGGFDYRTLHDLSSGATVGIRIGKRPKNTAYRWNVRAVMGTLKSAWCAEQNQTTQNTAAPSAPTDVKVLVKPGQFEIQITEVIDVPTAKYPIYINDSNDSETAGLISSIIRGKSKTTIPVGSKNASITIGYNTPYYFWVTTVDKWNIESAKVATDPPNDMLIKAATLLHYQKPWHLKHLEHVRKYISGEDQSDTYTVPENKVALITRIDLDPDNCGLPGSRMNINDVIIQQAWSATGAFMRNQKWTYGMYLEYGDHIDILTHHGTPAKNPNAEVRVDEWDYDPDISVQAMEIDSGTVYTIPAGKHGLLVFAYDINGAPTNEIEISIDAGVHYYSFMDIGLEKFDATKGCFELAAGYKLKGTLGDDIFIVVIEIPGT